MWLLIEIFFPMAFFMVFLPFSQLVVRLPIFKNQMFVLSYLMAVVLGHRLSPRDLFPSLLLLYSLPNVAPSICSIIYLSLLALLSYSISSSSSLLSSHSNHIHCPTGAVQLICVPISLKFLTFIAAYLFPTLWTIEPERYITRTQPAV
jgi:hypothetical protein